MNNRLLHIFR